ncbi:MAG: phosphopentomutase [Gammaproteobacteria bacterium]|jgi:phosphopentomutase|nr:phosphopentomutase [Gammaproteobacteria bacterium]
MTRAIVLVLDSFGIGEAPDAAAFKDQGADTLGHIAEFCCKQRAKALSLPNLARLGLAKAYQVSTGKSLPNDLDYHGPVVGAYGCAAEISKGKDTPSGHWEMMGAPVEFEWGCFPTTEKCFPRELIEAFIKEAGLAGVLGEKHASGTDIIKDLGEEHIKTGKPIVYTSADSVFQIAAHEQYFGLKRLYEICDIARKLVDPYNIGRVIARPFIGEVGSFKRTANRRDLAVPPPRETLLDLMVANNQKVISVGKIADIFAHRGISETIKAPDNEGIFNASLKALEIAPDKSLIFSNFVDFDSSYGHRRDPLGYAEALESFDKRLPELEALMQDDDILVISADHGCDPTFPGSDHTREHIPVLIYGKCVKEGSLGQRASFADIGQSLAAHFGLSPLKFGTACQIKK